MTLTSKHFVSKWVRKKIYGPPKTWLRVENYFALDSLPRIILPFRLLGTVPQLYHPDPKLTLV